jgi:membrane protease YdiL (CAAX protease family)
MSQASSAPGYAAGFVFRHPAATYFVLTFTISWAGALAVAAPQLLHHQSLSKTTGILMFPAMLLGPGLAGIVLSGVVDGRMSVRQLFARMLLPRVSARWYAALLIPPVLVLAVLHTLAITNSSAYIPNWFFAGALFGIPAGFLEEIGWMGYAFPKMRSPNRTLSASVQLGLLWALWHLPVINFLGAASPHGVYWLPFFLVFAFAMVAMRILIAWIYTNTKSLLLTQLMHVSSTGALVVFSPSRATAAQEVTWYAAYGAVLWIVVGIIVTTFGRELADSSTTPGGSPSPPESGESV